MTSSCPGPALVLPSAYAALALTSGPAYDIDLNCSVLLFSGSPSLALHVAFVTFSTGYEDVLDIRDGNTSSAPVLASLSGPYTRKLR